MSANGLRGLGLGAGVMPAGGVLFKVWAPIRKRVEVVIDGRAFPLTREAGGYFSGMVAQASAGTLYRFRLDGEGEFPDPASRFQPEGPHGPSQVIDPATFEWSDDQWRGLPIEGQILYEMHVGTFTPEGTFAAAARELPELARLGVTVIEVMPVADFPGRFGWGYDGVNLFAPSRLYGEPDDLRRFVGNAHAHGIAVILDVVYNHLGPDGNYLAQFSPHYFTKKHVTDWGDAINFDGEQSGPVREFFIANAGYWISEYHFDGLRLDATQNIYDDSATHILAEVTTEVRRAAGLRRTIVIAENEPQQVDYVRPRDAGGFGMDGLWNDDYHHSAMVAMTGQSDAYYTDYRGTPQEFVSALKYGYLYQGQWYRWQKQRRGTPGFDVPKSAFVTFLQNHDQVANSARGERAHVLTTPGLYRALTALTLLSPGTPMLFQGQEFAASSPFLFFADHKPDLAQTVREGRKEFLAQWQSLRLPEVRDMFDDPAARETFERCKLDLSERETHASCYALHRELIALRREDAVLRAPEFFDGAVISEFAFVLRFRNAHGDRLLTVNLGKDLCLDPIPEPLLAPRPGTCWNEIFSTEDARYGGYGTPAVETPTGWHLPRHSAILLAPGECGEPRPPSKS